MAHFAKIEDGVVTQVIVVDDKYEDNIQEFLESIGLDGTWIQTSYSGSFRKKFAGIGDTYDADNDVFKPEKIFDSWVWDDTAWDWIPPVEYPTDGKVYVWNEDSIEWLEIVGND